MVGLKDRIHILLMAFFLTLYVGLLSCLMIGGSGNRAFIMSGAVLFTVTLFSMHTYLKIENIEKMIKKRLSKK
jgi:hypothetical protein